jgi:hypothetical protein
MGSNKLILAANTNPLEAAVVAYSPIKAITGPTPPLKTAKLLLGDVVADLSEIYTTAAAT